MFRSAILRFAALVFACQIVGAGTILLVVRELTRAQLSADAGREAERLRDRLLDAYRRGGAAQVAADAAARPRPAWVVLLVDARGRRVSGNIADWPPTLVPGAAAANLELFRIDHDVPEMMRVVATALPDGGRLLTGHVVDREARFTVVMEEAMVIAFPLAIALAALAAWFAARMIEARLGATVRTAQAVTAGGLEARVPLDGADDAFDELATAINAMLDRIAALMAELKLATDGLAHDLRSPLTRMRATLERALAEAADERGRASVARAVQEGDRLLAMLDTALRISRAEAGLGREAFARIDLAASIADLVEMYGPLAEDRGATIAAATPPALVVAAHRELIGQALANLIDNALKYGAGAVAVSLMPRPEGEVDLIVADDGPGIAPDDRAKALRRFGRLDPARSIGGAGLGLSLAAAVAHLHGGRIALEDNAPGLRVRMTLALRAGG